MPPADGSDSGNGLASFAGLDPGMSLGQELEVMLAGE
jgi:hypothetical protein